MMRDIYRSRFLRFSTASLTGRSSFHALAKCAAILLIFAAFVTAGRAQDKAAPAPAPAQSSAPAAQTAAPNPAAPAAQPAAPSLAAPPGAPSPAPEAPGANAVAPNAAAPNAEAPPAPAVPTAGPVQSSNRLASFGAEVLDHALNADIIVQAVMVGLILAALLTWTVWLKKLLELRSARIEVRRGVRILDAAATFAQAHDEMRKARSPVVAQFMQATAHEIRLSGGVRSEGLKERIALRLERLEIAASRKISRGTGVLATIGSTAPFVGLFGTVWGIMNSFIGIENAHTTNLAVVAPGIAQALLATALGLAAAIPAVMTYNALARSTTNYRTLLGDASAQVMRLVSRDFDRAKVPLAQAAE
jgi:biopolymer transport protein ExbB